MSALSFMNYSKTVSDVLQLRGGKGDLCSLIDDYRILENTYAHRPMDHPVIMLVDNDGGPKDKLFGKAKSLCHMTITHASAEPFFHLKHNLYLVKTPSLPENQQTCIEDFFPTEILKQEIDGKPFNPDHEHGDHNTYSKQIFALQVVKPQAATIDFSGFVPLLDRIAAVLDDYEAKMGAAPAAIAAK